MYLRRKKLFAELRSQARAILGTVFGVSLIVYLAYHTVQGERGLLAYWQLSNQVELAQARHVDLRAQRERLRHRVNLLHPRSLDPDILEERARFILGYSYADELVIFNKSR